MKSSYTAAEMFEAVHQMETLKSTEASFQKAQTKTFTETRAKQVVREYTAMCQIQNKLGLCFFETEPDFVRAARACLQEGGVA